MRQLKQKNPADRQSSQVSEALDTRTIESHLQLYGILNTSILQNLMALRGDCIFCWYVQMITTLIHQSPRLTAVCVITIVTDKFPLPRSAEY